MSKLLVHRAALTNIARRIALAAGEITLEYYDRGGFSDAEEKSDGSPVTQADRAAEEYIVKELYAVLPDVPVVGEELVAAGKTPDLSSADYVWFVDALDGTKEFIAGGEDYTVNIALVKNGAPVLGVVYAPVRGELYAGFIEEDGAARAVRWLEETNNEKELRVRSVPRGGVTVLASKSHNDGGRLDSFLNEFKVEKVLKKASSLKLCAIAAGKADLYPRFGPTCAWDIAAGHAILQAAGGMVCTFEGAVLAYGSADPLFLNPEFIASSFDTREIS